MRRGSLFWGSIIVLVGLVLLFNNLFPAVNLHLYLWPGLLILLGVWFLLGPVLRRGTLESESVSIPLSDIQSAEIRFLHGAGKMTLRAGSQPGVLLEGEFAGGLRQDLERDGNTARLRLRSNLFADGVVVPGATAGEGLVWNVGLARALPLQLTFETGACEAQLDLTELLVTDVHLQTGASSTELTLPAYAGLTRARIVSGLAGVVINVPQGVAARIKVSSGLAGIKISGRFPLSGGMYSSPDFEGAVNRVEISIDTGLGSVEIR